MHQIQLSDQLYQEAQARAADAGFINVDDYVAQVLKEEFGNGFDLPPGFFTPSDSLRLPMQRRKSIGASSTRWNR